jgi:hypothetical protein
MRYLAAKKSVDERALNWQVWQCLVAALRRATPAQPLRILEVGAGIGGMVERLLVGDVLTHATYTAIDKAPTLIAEAHRRLLQWAGEQGFQVDENRQRQLQLRRARQHIRIETEAIDVARFIAREHGRRVWDLLIGQAFLDLIDMPATLPGFCSLVRPGGLLYFPLSRLEIVAPAGVCLPTCEQPGWMWSLPAAPIGWFSLVPTAILAPRPNKARYISWTSWGACPRAWGSDKSGNVRGHMSTEHLLREFYNEMHRVHTQPGNVYDIGDHWATNGNTY